MMQRFHFLLAEPIPRPRQQSASQLFVEVPLPAYVITQ
jgi:hypothetical protein